MKRNINDKRHYYPALRGVFGDWIYYTCLMPAKEVAQRIDFADKIHPNKGLSTLIQRRLKSGRSTEIGDYLMREKQRFFNSMVVAVYDGDPVWHGFSNFTPQVEDIKLKDVPEEAEDSVGFLSFTGNEKIFALDGQHRLAKQALGRDGLDDMVTSLPVLDKRPVTRVVDVSYAGKEDIQSGSSGI